MRLLLTLLLVAAPLLCFGDCRTTLGTTNICADAAVSPAILNLGPFVTDSQIQRQVEQEIIQLTGGTCASPGTCTVTELKGSASTPCFEAALNILCKKAAASYIVLNSTAACAAAAAAVPLISDCSTVLNTTCLATLASSLDRNSFCQNFQCDNNTGTSNCGDEGTCIPTTGFPTLCTCATARVGTRCAWEKKACPGPVGTGTDFCSSHGKCNVYTGACTCDLDFSGADCAKVSCMKSPSDTSECNSQGVCSRVGVCQCNAGWVGAGCTIKIEDRGMNSSQFFGAVFGGLCFTVIMFAIVIFAFVKS